MMPSTTILWRGTIITVVLAAVAVYSRCHRPLGDGAPRFSMSIENLVTGRG